MVSSQVAKISTNTSNNDNSSSNTRRKIEIKRVEESSKRHVTFSKRKQGLFNKVTELSILCQAETALIVKSQNGKLYSCGYPASDTVIRRFLNGGPPSKHARAQKNKQKECVETLRIKYEATQEVLKKEKKHRDEAEANKALMGFPCWWDYSIDKMGLEELEQFKASLEQLKINLMATMEERVNSIQFQPMMAPFPSMLPMQYKFSNFTPILNNGGLSTKQEQEAWNLRNNGIVSSSNNSSLGTWGLGNNAIANSSHSYFNPNVDFGHYYHN